MSRENTFNFSAGPSVLPDEVLETAAAEMLDFRSTGMSVMEMSHRSSVYQDIFIETKARLKSIMDIPDTHEILFLQGGASTQFSMVPLNLLSGSGRANYAITGNFADIAAGEAAKYGKVNIAASSTDRGHTYIPAQNELCLDPDADYFYYCANNTIYGTEWHYVPQTGKVPIVADMSSNILTQKLDISKFGIIFAGAQKNMGPAGVTLVIINKSLAGREMGITPLMMSYKRLIDKDSMYNTPPCYSIYMVGLVLKWLEKMGGIEAMEELKKEKSSILYDFLDNSSLFKGCACPEARSYMNVTFTTGNAELDASFASEAAKAGFLNVKGHRSVGGMRASIYNAQPLNAARQLRDFMKDFEVKNHG